MVNLIEWINSTPNATVIYDEWRTNKVTQLMIAGLRNKFRTILLQEPTGERALQKVGFTAGRDDVIFDMEHLDTYRRESITGDEGFDQKAYLMNVEGFSEEDAEHMIKESEDD